ncbi:MAG: hypothetical protein KBT47_01460, partial [Armatimonadetes bacterium]|nr:hypothetical protein [Candidatus Hippobium faecium]
DISGEFYFAPVTIKEAGWNYITSKVSQSVPWASGDKNEKQDPPMEFMTICVNYTGSPEKGTLIVDQIEAEVETDTDIEEEAEDTPLIDETDTETDQILLPGQDFEDVFNINTYTTNPAFYTKAEITDKNVSGKKGAKLSWKFTPDTDSGYNVYYIQKTAPGTIKEIEFSAYTEEAYLGAQITAWVLDENGEMYVGAVKTDTPGFKKYTMKISDRPAWESGDKNGIPDGNMTLNALLIERRGAPIEGYVIIDDIKFLTEAPYTRFILSDIHTADNPDMKIWSKKGTLEITCENQSNETAKNLSYRITVTDTKTDKTVKTEKIKAFTLKSKEKTKKQIFLDLPYSHYIIKSELYMGNKLIGYKTYPLTFLKGKCGTGSAPAEEAYMTKCGYFGGVTWEALPSFLRDSGCRWTRGFRDDWKGIEYEKDKFNTDKLINSVREYAKYGIDHILLMCTYNQPPWRQYTNPDFAPAYGKLHEAIAKTGELNQYELGNEDNSSKTKLYAEVGRNGAAGIRKYDSDALIANSATAGIDFYFFDVQKKKGLLDRLDLLIVHPYCNNNNPEDFGLYANSRKMIDLIDSLGGYKDLWSTEYGYNDGTEGPRVLPDRTRSQYYVRHTLIQTAAGYRRCGLFAWNYYWGIFEQSKGTLRGLSVETMAKQLEGYRFAGILSNGPQIFCYVYEKLGADPIAVCWTNEGEADFDLGTGLSYYDIYNNKITKFTGFSEDPVYVHNISQKLLETAWKNVIQREIESVQKNGLNLAASADCETLWNTLKETGEKINITERSAASFHILKALLTKARMGECPKEVSSSSLYKTFEKEAKDFLEQARLGDTDYPKLRWALNEFINLDLERKFATEKGKDDFAEKLTDAERILSEFAKNYLMNDRDRRQNQVWAYLYNIDGEEVNEKLTFVPNIPTRVKVRVNNYALNPHTAEISLSLPEGWTVSPEKQIVELSPDKNAETYFDITAKETDNTKNLSITALCDIGVGTVGKTTFTDIEVLNAITVSQRPSHGRHPEAPMEFYVRNSGDTPKNGTIKVFSADTLIGSLDFENLSPKEGKIYKVPLTDTPKDYNNMKVTVSGDGYQAEEIFKAEYCFAPQKTIKNSEELAEYPLFIDKEDYDWGDFMGTWTKNDLSA